MDEAQRFSILAGLVVLLACVASYRARRARPLVVASALGAGLGAVAFPRLLGLAMGYQFWFTSPPGRRWATEFRDIVTFYTAAPVADTVPRGAALGLVLGLVVGLLWSGRGRRRRRDGAHSH